jgi:hypothetical protein
MSAFFNRVKVERSMVRSMAFLNPCFALQGTRVGRSAIEGISAERAMAPAGDRDAAEERARVTNAEGQEHSDFRQNVSTLYTFAARQKPTTDWEASMRSLESTAVPR